jgi:PhnB protein
MPPTPDADTSIAPILSVRRGQAIDFYKAAFGGTELFCLDAPDGTVVAYLSVGLAIFWLAEESPEHCNFSPESLWGRHHRPDHGR